jgi:hypothetical protein
VSHIRLAKVKSLLRGIGRLTPKRQREGETPSLWRASSVLFQETVTVHWAYIWLYVPAGHLILPTNWYL